MKVKIYVPEIECESCVKLIERKFKAVQGIESLKVHDDSADITYDESLVKPEVLVQTIKDLGFRADVRPFERKTIKERLKDLKANKTKYELELKGISYAFATFLLLVLLQVTAYFAFLKNIPNFISVYGWWILYLDISVVALTAALWHFSSYKAKITCMVGMMVGMTFGMQTGMMLGAVIGATNGFFTGALVGMILGVAVGAFAGKCCGVMGIMEGMMAGVMGGTMGAMISVMMLFDHILLFMPVFILINIIILFGLSYMLFEEVVENKEVKKVKIDFATFASVCVIVTGVLFAIILYAPKSLGVGFI